MLNVKHILEKLFTKNSVFINPNGRYRLATEGFVSITDSEYEKLKPRILILSRDTYSEGHKRYPLDDPQDLKAILLNDFDSYTITSVGSSENGHTTVKYWKIKPNHLQLIEGVLALWIPETLLHEDFEEDCLYDISRLGGKLFSYGQSGFWQSSEAKGVFADATYFLMSSGVHANTTKALNQNQYAVVLRQGLTNLPLKVLKKVFSGQELLSRMQNVLSVKQLFAGVLAGITLFYGLMYGFYQYRISDLENSIANQNIKQVIELQNSYTKNVGSYKAMLREISGTSVEARLWEVVADILLQGVQVVQIWNPDGEIQIRVQSGNATDGLTKIRKIPDIKEVDIVGAIQEYRGEQRYSIVIELHSTEKEKLNDD